jgi:hypothetical protein
MKLGDAVEVFSPQVVDFHRESGRIVDGAEELFAVNGPAAQVEVKSIGVTGKVIQEELVESFRDREDFLLGLAEPSRVADSRAVDDHIIVPPGKFFVPYFPGGQNLDPLEDLIEALRRPGKQEKFVILSLAKMVEQRLGEMPGGAEDGDSPVS